jgi:DNA gyrase/topoisomerase IV subunit A
MSEQVMIISADGIVIRTPTKEKDPTKGITVQGRSTQGVRLMKLNEGDKVVAITCFCDVKEEPQEIAKEAEKEPKKKKETKKK